MAERDNSRQRPCRAGLVPRAMAGRSLPGSSIAIEATVPIAVGATGSLCRESGGYTRPERERPSRIVSGGVVTLPAPALSAGTPAVTSRHPRAMIMNRDTSTDPSPVRVDGALRPIDVRMPHAAKNPAVRGGFSEDQGGGVPKRPRQPLEAIRAKCVDRSSGSLVEVRNCMLTSCALYPFRMGRNPNRRRAAQ